MNLLQRLKAPTPKFWRTVQARAIVAGLTLAGMINSGHMPEPVLPCLKYMAFAAGLLVLFSQATIGDTTPPAAPPTDSETAL